MADFLTNFIFRSELQPRHGIEVKQVQTSLSFSETKLYMFIAQESGTIIINFTLLTIITDLYLLIYHI